MHELHLSVLHGFYDGMRITYTQPCTLLGCLMYTRSIESAVLAERRWTLKNTAVQLWAVTSVVS